MPRKRRLTDLARMGKRLLSVVGSSRGDKLHGGRREGSCPASWRVSADYYTFKTF